MIRQMQESYDLGEENCYKDEVMLTVVVVGASGDLARKKIFPALFALYYQGLLPPHLQIVGYARSDISNEDFREKIYSTLGCRIDAKEDCDNNMQEFLKRVSYVQGQYDETESYEHLNDQLKVDESMYKSANRIFFLSIPPGVFVDAAKGAAASASSPSGWTRVIVEKPFGKDLESNRQLDRDLKEYLSEEQIFRIDHYLGKELIENLTVLRFANLVFEPLWSRDFIRNVQVIFSEDFGTEGRGGYFDEYGIIRDVIQNHLLQILALFAMECPVSLGAEDIRNEKVKLLRNISPINLEDVVIGQYRGTTLPDGRGSLPGYLDDDTVPDESTTETFAAVALFVQNARWDGVPFLLKAGKALQRRSAQIRVQFRHVPGNVFTAKFGKEFDRNTNELVIRIQPEEAIYMKINNKVPGLGLNVTPTRLDLSYKDDLKVGQLPDAYERLLLDVVNGDKRLFIRNDELDAAWKLFTPVLDSLAESGSQPELYPYGSRGPISAHYLAAKYGIRWGDLVDDDE